MIWCSPTFPVHFHEETLSAGAASSLTILILTNCQHFDTYQHMPLGFSSHLTSTPSSLTGLNSIPSVYFHNTLYVDVGIVNI